MYLILAEPGEDILLRDGTKSNNHAAAAVSVGGVTFFNTLGTELDDYDLDKRIGEQELEVIKAENNLNSLDKKRQSLEKDLDQVRNEIETQDGELQKRNTILAQLKEQKSLRKKRNKLVQICISFHCG